MDKLSAKSNDYNTRLHRLGRISTTIMLIALISVPIVMSIVFKIDVNAKNIATSFIGAFSLFGVVGAIEFFSFAPVLGAGGQYLAFITGNISNMKLPAALSGMKIAKYEPGTKEAEVISMIAIAVSSLVTTLIVFLGLIFISRFLPLLQSPVLAPAFTNLMPALLGALATPFFIKDYKTASVPCIIAAVLTVIIGYPAVARYQSLLMPAFLIIAIAWSYFLYSKKNKISE